MARDDFSWEPEMVEKMTTNEITAKMKTLVPNFDLGEFATKTERYISCEDLADEEYYSQATFSDVDEDFIWIACEVLWQRLFHDRPSVEHGANQIDDNIETLFEAQEEGKVRKLVQLSTMTFDLIFQHIITKTPTGYELNQEFYDRLNEATTHDINEIVGTHLIMLQLKEKHKKVKEFADIFYQVLKDDMFLDLKARSLFALKR